MKVRTYALLGETDRKCLEGRVLERVNQWVSQWFLTEVGVSVADSFALDEACLAILNRRTPMVLEYQGDFRCAVVLDDKCRRALYSLLLGERAETNSPSVDVYADSIVNDLLERALLNLGEYCTPAPSGGGERAFGSKRQSIPAQAAQKGSGWQCLTIRFGSCEIDIVLPVNTVDDVFDNSDRRHAEAGAAAFVSFSKALAGRKVSAEVLLARVELSVASLASMRVGDVIQLDKRINEPSQLLFPGTEVSCEGYIGKSEGRRAISVTPQVKSG